MQTLNIKKYSKIINYSSLFRERATSTFAGLHVGPLSWLNWTFEILVFVEGGKPENLETEKPSEQGKNQQILINMYDTGPELNLSHIGGRQMLSPRRHPSYQYNMIVFIQ